MISLTVGFDSVRIRGSRSGSDGPAHQRYQQRRNYEAHENGEVGISKALRERLAIREEPQLLESRGGGEEHVATVACRSRGGDLLQLRDHRRIGRREMLGEAQE